MIKEYFWVAFIGVLFNATLILMDVAGFLPLNILIFSAMLLAVFLLALFRPIWVFWIFVISLPLESVIISSPQIPISLRPFQLIAVMLFAATTFSFLFKFKKENLPSLPSFERKKFFRTGNYFNIIDILILVLIILSFVSLRESLNFNSTLKLNLVLVSFGMIYFLSRFYLQEKQRKLEALWFFLTTSLPVLLFGIYQSIAYKLNWVDFQIFAERSNGTFTEPDWFGIYLVFLGALIYWVKLYLFRTKNSTMIGDFEIRKAGQWVMNFHLFLVFTVLLLTVARSAWIGFSVVTILYLLLLTRQKIIFNIRRFITISFFRETFILGWVFLFSIFFVVSLKLSNFNLVDRASSSVSGLEEITISCEVGSKVPNEIFGVEVLEDYDCRHIRLEEIEIEKALGMEVKKVYRTDPNIEIRKNIYETTWREIKNHVWIGQGLGSSAEVLGQDSYGHGFNASNIFLEIWFSFGLIGLSVFVLILAIYAFNSLKNIFLKSKANSPMAFFVLLTGVALLISNFFNAGIFLVILWVWLAAVNN